MDQHNASGPGGPVGRAAPSDLMAHYREYLERERGLLR